MSGLDDFLVWTGIMVVRSFDFSVGLLSVFAIIYWASHEQTSKIFHALTVISNLGVMLMIGVCGLLMGLVILFSIYQWVFPWELMKIVDKILTCQ